MIVLAMMLLRPRGFRAVRVVERMLADWLTLFALFLTAAHEPLSPGAADVGVGVRLMMGCFMPYIFKVPGGVGTYRLGFHG